jgi:hypothetical protein
VGQDSREGPRTSFVYGGCIVAGLWAARGGLAIALELLGYVRCSCVSGRRHWKKQQASIVYCSRAVAVRARSKTLRCELGAPR